jgi:glycosyltransferase involved in cell wall biosynthesis
MKISVCIVTNRPVFEDFYRWNYERQTYQEKELIVVDGPGSIGEKRNKALELATGDAVVWFDDDDWQHPEKLTWLAKELEDPEIQLAGWNRGIFMHLQNRALCDFRCSQMVASTAIIRTETARKAVFEKRNIGEDTLHLRELWKTHKHTLLTDTRLHGVWLVHSMNTSIHRSYNWRIVPPIEDPAWDSETDEQLRRLAASL